MAVGELLAKALREYEKTMQDSSRRAEQMTLKVLGSNEYLGEGEVIDYTYVRRCLKKGKDIELLLVPNPLADLPPLPPPPSPPPSRPSPGDLVEGQLSPHVDSLWDISPQFTLRVKVLSVENLRSVEEALRMRAKAGASWQLFVRMCVYIGGNPLCDVKETSLVAADDTGNPQWSEWLDTGSIRVCCLPRAARVCYTLVGRPHLGRRELDEIALGWVSMQLIGHDEQLVQGVTSLRLWADEEANPIGANMENVSFYGAEPPVLFVQYDSYQRPVAMPKAAQRSSLEQTELGASPGPEKVVRLKRIIEGDPLSPLSADDKRLIWQFKHFILSSPAALPKFLQCHSWLERSQVAKMHSLLHQWAPLKPTEALELLDAKFADEEIRAYAVSRLDGLSDAELSDFVLQLTQVLKYEARHNSALARMLLRRALACPHQVGHQFFWSLKAEMHLPEVCERFGLLIEEYMRCCGPHREQLMLQSTVEQLLIKAANLVKTVPKSERVALLREELSAVQFPPKFQLPLDPRFECSGLIVEKCKCMDSKKVPLWLVFKNADPQGRNLTVMFKCGDDLRQDALTLQIIRIMEHQWERAGLDLRLSPYSCVATGDEIGFIEIVLNSDTTANISKKYGGGAGAAFKKEPMAQYLREHNPTDREYEEAVDTFCLSLAGYCVATYVIGIGDRHNDNVMLSKVGNLFHIDFGHFLGNFKWKFGVKRERAPFVFTPDFAYVLGDKGAEKFDHFISICCQAYNILRQHSHEFINLFSLMLSTGIPELQKVEDIYWLRGCLMPHMTDEQAAEYFTKLIYTALATLTTQVNNAVHIIAHS
uniref:phosphatidylinositol 3-kinase n=1 Tax=Calcidiscus leptoporus TaxID=127549 RepID=A0A7S0JDC0_9EUKA